jgi:hypothetical protein
VVVRRKNRLNLFAALFAILCAFTAISGIVFISESSPAYVTETYTTNSAINSSQWLVLDFTGSAPLSVSASNTGMIPVQSSLSALNHTTIGTVCSQVEAGGGCLGFVTVTQTGWYLDSTDSLLYVHYEGGPSVTISVELNELEVTSTVGMSSTVVSTTHHSSTVTITTTSPSTTTETLTTSTTMKVTTTVTTTSNTRTTTYTTTSKSTGLTTRTTTKVSSVKVVETIITYSQSSSSGAASITGIVGPLIEVVVIVSVVGMVNSMVKKHRGKAK